MPNLSPIALLAGKGMLPQLLIEVFQAQERPFVVLPLKEQAEESLVASHPHLWISFGEVGKALEYFKANHIKQVVMAGGVTRPSLATVRPDWQGIKWLTRLSCRALGDDGLLRGVIGLLEEEGYEVIAPDDLLKDLLVPDGLLTTCKPDDQAWRDIERGLEVLSSLGPADVGQAVVVQNDIVLGIEAIEGTDALLERVKDLKRPGLGGVLIKTSKRNQERRADLPTIGPETLHRVAAAGLRGIAIEANKTLLLNQPEILKLAKDNDLFLVALPESQCHKLL